MNVIGVSPAFIISKYGKDFTIYDYIEAVSAVKRLGFKAIQLEIYSDVRLTKWESVTNLLYDKIKDNDLCISQFVAHLLMVSFLGNGINKDEIIETFKRVLGVAEKFKMERVITVPVGSIGKNLNIAPGNTAYTERQKQVDEVIRIICEIAQLSDFKVALEILPGSIIGGVKEFVAMSKRLAMGNLGINLDTGHANVSETNIETLPFILKDRIFGTHISDNNGVDNLSLRPGKGNIDWKIFFTSLMKVGYKGSLDIEIHCRAEETESEYSSAYDYIKELFKKEGLYGK